MVIGAEHRDACLRLRARGYTYKEIGEELGFTRQNAHLHVKAALKELNEDIAEQAEEVRRVEDERLAMALKVAIKIMEDGFEEDVQLKAIAQVVKLSDRRAKLWGLDAPKQHEISGMPDVSIQILPPGGKDG